MKTLFWSKFIAVRGTANGFVISQGRETEALVVNEPVVRIVLPTEDRVFVHRATNGCLRFEGKGGSNIVTIPALKAALLETFNVKENGRVLERKYHIGGGMKQSNVMITTHAGKAVRQ
jgi:hypothetical protein